MKQIRLAIQRAFSLLPYCLLCVIPQASAQNSNYGEVRKAFKTNLIKQEGSPQKPDPSDSADLPPSEATQIFLISVDNLKLKAWINMPADKNNRKYPAVVFLHGGLSFGKADWDMTKPFRDSGYIVITPMLRGENSQKGIFSFLYNEVDDVLAAAAYLKQQPFIDNDRVYLAGHSVGGILSLLTVMSRKSFKKAVSFSGLPDMVSYHRYVIDPNNIPFDTTDRREFEMRSPMAYARSFSCPIRLYFGTEEPWIMGNTSERMAIIAKKGGLDVKAVAVEGGHMSAVEEEMKLAIRFFNAR
jgi:dipeptidyl aminopeptidase/acylaminoacyl peptidase